MKKIYCMIIGDIVSSQKIDVNIRANIQIKLKRTLEKINFDYDKYICSRFSVTLGDELQGGLYTIYPLFDILNRIKQCISPYKIRFGIGIDTMTTEIQYTDSLASDGMAYYFARKAVDNLKHHPTYEYGYQFGSEQFDLNYANDLMKLVDCISKDWTKTQKDYIYKLQENTELELSTIAKSMEVNVSTVSRTITKTNYRLVEEVITNLSKKINEEMFIGKFQSEFQAKYNQACEMIDQRDLENAKKILCNPTTNVEKMEYYSLLATICNAEYDSKKAIEYASKAINILDKNHKCKKIRLLNILGICYTNLEQYELAKNSFDEAIQLIEIIDSTESWKMYTFGNLARLYSKMENYQFAEDSLKEVDLILDNTFPNDFRSRIVLQSTFAKLYHRWKKYDISLRMFESALQLSECMIEKHSKSNAILKYDFAKLLIDINNEDFVRIYNLLTDASESFKKSNFLSHQILCYNLLFDLCIKQGENIKAEEIKNKIKKLEER